MRRFTRARHLLLPLFLSFGVSSCGAPKEPLPAPVAPLASVALPSITPIADEPLEAIESLGPVKQLKEEGAANVTGWQRKDGEDYFCVDVKSLRPNWDWHARGGTLTATVENLPATILFGNAISLGEQKKKSKRTVVRCAFFVRAKESASSSLNIQHAFLDTNERAVHRIAYDVKLERTKAYPIAGEWRTQWLESMGSMGGFSHFAQGRLNPPRDAGLLENTWRLQSALEWMTPVDVVNDALETNRAQFSGVREPATVPISSMAGPKLETYPWAKLTQALAVSSPMMEPLAAFVPADFYFIRFATLPKLVEAFDVFEKRFATPLYGNAMLFGHDVAAAERDLSSRYHTELGLRTGPLTKALGGVVVSEVAIVGSDPYVVEGTDLSLVFRVKNKPAFELALQESLRSFAEKHGTIETEAGPQGSTLSKSKDGQVHTTRGWIKGDVYVVSNSANAFSKIAGAANGKAKSLGAEPDLQYILARDTATKTANTEMFAFMGEEFVRSVTGPKQKLAELRRAIALMELRAPGYAELLFRRYTGRAPKNVQELRDAKMLRKEDLEHRDGSSIHYELGEAATSKWGSLARPKALLDLPEVTMLTKSEAEAYKHFSATYNDSYARYIDPISMRAKIAMDTEKPFLEYDVRVLPPSKDRLGNDERKWIREFGLGRIQAPRQDEGLHLAVGIGKGSHLRRELEEFGSNVPFVGKVQLEWIGDVASFGLFETNTLPNLYARMNREGGRGTMNMISQLTKLPLYVSLEVSSPLALGVLLSRVKKEVVGNGGEGIEWDAAFTHHDATVTRIGEKKGTGASSQGNELQAFYVVHKKQLVVTFREDVMRRAIDMIDAGTFAKRADETALGAGSANLSMQASLAPAGAFIKALQRSVSAAAMRESYRTRPSEELAETIFLAYPEAQKNTAMFEEISTRLLGGVPSAGTRGSRYTYGAEGIVDPVLGSRIDERRLREDPDGATGLLDLLSTLARFDAKISFDPEAVSSEVKAQETLRSLHFQGRVELRK